LDGIYAILFVPFCPCHVDSTNFPNINSIFFTILIPFCLYQFVRSQFARSLLKYRCRGGDWSLIW